MELVFVTHCDIDADVERALLYDKGEEAARLTQSLEAGVRVFESWVLSSHGRMLSQEGCNWSAQMSAEHLEELPAIVEQIEGATGARMSVGVGSEPSEALIAQRIAEDRGGDPAIILYTPDLSEEARRLDELSDDEADALDGGSPDDDGVVGGAEAGAPAAASGLGSGLAKADDNQREPDAASQVVQGALSPTAAAPSAPPSASMPSASPPSPGGQPQPGQAPQQGAPQGEPSDDEVLQQVGQVLKQFQAQMPLFEQMKQQAPQAYAAVMGMVQGFVAMAHKLGNGGEDESPPPEAKDGMQKAEASLEGKLRADGVAQDRELATKSAAEEWKAIDDYGDRSRRAQDPKLKAIFDHAREEEEEHHRLLDAWLRGDEEDATVQKGEVSAVEQDPSNPFPPAGTLDKAALPAAHHHVVLPPGSHGVGARSRSVKVVEPITGKTSWHAVSSGQKLSGDGHSLSTRVAECPSTDTPERRAQQAGLVGQPTTTSADGSDEA